MKLHFDINVLDELKENEMGVREVRGREVALVNMKKLSLDKAFYYGSKEMLHRKLDWFYPLVRSVLCLCYAHVTNVLHCQNTAMQHVRQQH